MVAPPATLADPSPKFHENEYGVVPPDAFTVKLTEAPTVPVVGAAVNARVRAKGEIVIVAVEVASLPLMSVTLTWTW